MSLEDSFRKHGVKAVRVDMSVVLDATKAAIDTLRRGNQPLVVSIAVAAAIVQMRADLTGVPVDEVLEVVRAWLAAGLIPDCPPPGGES